MNTIKMSPEMQALLVLVALGVTPKEEFGQAGMQARNKAGVPKWTVEVRSRTLGESFKVTVTSQGAPDVTEFTPVVFDGLTVGATQSGSFWWAANGVITPATAKATA